MAKSTRFSTTVITNNLVANQKLAGYYLDGRMSIPRESGHADITLDREDIGSFYSIFGNTGQDLNQLAVNNKKYLDKFFERVKVESRFNIDQEINELADCAVNVSGRSSVGSNGVDSFFSGVVAREGELVAITLGSASAYLYRNDILYPLTSEDLPDESEFDAHQVPNINIYCAGVAGTIRYSNIAQIQQDDCFVLLNKSVKDILGYKNLLAILNDAYDQADAAQRITQVAQKANPHLSSVVMIGYVESINNLDKAGVKSLTGRMAWGQKPMQEMSTTNFNNLAAPVAAAAVASAAAASATPAPVVPEQAPTEKAFDIPAPLVPPTDTAGVPPIMPPVQPGPHTQPIQKQGYVEAQPSLEGYTSPVPMQQPINSNQYVEYDSEDAPILQDVQESNSSLLSKILIGFLIICIIAVAAVIGYVWFSDSDPEPTETTTSTVAENNLIPPVPTPTPAPTPAPQESSAETTPVEETTTTTPAPAPAPTPAPTPAPAPAPTQAPNPPQGGGTYTVQAGDSLWDIANAHTDPDNVNDYVQKIKDLNVGLLGADGTSLTPGDVLKLP